jgi:hypothetical protein
VCAYYLCTCFFEFWDPLSSNGGLVSAFGYTILVLVPGFFSWKKIIFHTWPCTGFGYRFKKLSHQSGSGIRSKADNLHGIYVRYKPVLCDSSFLSYENLGSWFWFFELNLESVWAVWVWAPFFSFKEPLQFWFWHTHFSKFKNLLARQFTTWPSSMWRLQIFLC